MSIKDFAAILAGHFMETECGHTVEKKKDVIVKILRGLFILPHSLL